MCIAILKKDGVNVPQSQLEESFMSNPDGSGYLFANNGKLSVKKGFFTFLDFHAFIVISVLIPDGSPIVNAITFFINLENS